VARNLNDRVLPCFDTIRIRWPNKDLGRMLDSMAATITEIASPAGNGVPDDVRLTPMESRVIDLIRQGRTRKEIAQLLGITVRGVTFHRGNIRRKPGLRNRKKNLQTALNEMKW
jgi:DNA-binding CsgD family transcriptional regulator